MAVTFLKNTCGYDDSLDACGVHGVGGIWGALATGLFASPEAQKGYSGLFYGNPGQLWVQFEAVGITIVYSLALTLVLLKVVDVFGKLRASEHEETVGLDLTQHRETAYTMID